MQIALIGLILISLVLSVVAVVRHEALSWQFAIPDVPAGDDTPAFTTVFDYTVPTGQAHAPGIVLDDDGVSLIWFQGSAEAQADVDIYASYFSTGPDGWQASEPAPLVTRAGLSAAFEPEQLVVTLGNAIQNEGAQDALYATVVSVGGWAMASVADVRLKGGAPASAQKLNLSPLLNRSHLVKSPMVGYADGSHALPAYFEMGSTYGVLARLGPEGQVRDTRRIPSKGVKAIQPMIVPLDADKAVAFLRDFDASGHLWISRTSDGGRSWSEVTATEVYNPSAPVAALSLGGERILAVMNDDAEARHELRLSLSEDGGNSWRMIHRFADDAGDARYPMLRRLASGDLMLAYSHSTQAGHPRACIQRSLGDGAMIGVLASVFVAILLGWIIYALAGFALSLPLALTLGVVVGAASALLLRETIAVRGFVALLGPIGVVLPLLALRHVFVGMGMPVIPFGTVEMLAFLLIYMAFLAASMGVLPVDLYRWGYAPIPVAVMVLALCGYGALSGNLFIPLVAVLGQAIWVMGWGSSNWFDHLLHALLVPIVIVVLLGRLIWI